MTVRGRYIQFHGYILCPSSDTEAPRGIICFLGTQCSSGSHWGVGWAGRWWGFVCVVCSWLCFEYLSGQCYQKDRESQWLEQALFGGSQASEPEGKEIRKHLWVEQRARESRAERGNLSIRAWGGSEALHFLQHRTWRHSLSPRTRLKHFGLLPLLDWKVNPQGNLLSAQQRCNQVEWLETLRDEGSDVTEQWASLCKWVWFCGSVLWAVRSLL